MTTEQMIGLLWAVSLLLAYPEAVRPDHHGIRPCLSWRRLCRVTAPTGIAGSHASRSAGGLGGKQRSMTSVAGSHRDGGAQLSAQEGKIIDGRPPGRGRRVRRRGTPRPYKVRGSTRLGGAYTLRRQGNLRGASWSWGLSLVTVTIAAYTLGITMFSRGLQRERPTGEEP